MALVTIQRVPTSESSSEVDTTIGETSNEETEEIGELISIPSPAKKTKKKLLRQGSISENFFAVKGAALILPRQSSFAASMEVMQVKKYGGDLQNHLYAIFKQLRPQDSIKLAVRLESWAVTRVRYLVIVTTIGRQDTEENIILGMDFASQTSTTCTIGLVIPIWSDTTIKLDGDGGFKVAIGERTHTFKPVSVQAMWSALQALHKCVEMARQLNYYYGSLFLTWTCYYESQISSSRLCLNEWEYCEMVWTRRPEFFEEKESERKQTELKIRTKLKEVMMKMDLDSCTTRDVRQSLERVIDLDLQQYKQYVETEMLNILGQMDTPTKILDFLYLGSGWNASNQDELVELGITHILNVTIEVDNFFPDDFIYKNIKLLDVETSDLLQYWNDTWKFIKSAQKQGGKCLVHCKMGISRSGATVSAFLMKENLWTMEKALAYVEERRPIVHPNKAFMRQLVEYEGILKASAQRHNRLFRSRSESNLSSEHGHTGEECSEPPSQNNSSSDQPLSFDLNRRLLDLTVLPYRSTPTRPKSWSPDDSRQYYLNNDDLIYIDPYEENSDMVSSHMSEPQAYFTPSERNGLVDAGRSTRPAYDKRKKWRRRHTERIFRNINIDFDAMARSEDSVFANTGEFPIPRVDNWITEKAEPGVDERKKSGRLSSPAAIHTSKNNLAVEEGKNPSHSSVASPMSSPSFKSIKNVKVSDLKSRFSEESLVKLEMQESEMSIKVDIQDDIGNKSIGVREIIAVIESPTDEGLKLIQNQNKEKKEDASNEDFVQVRERSFSENQVFVKSLVNEYESKYSPDAPGASGSSDNVSVKENTEDDQPTPVGIARSQSLPSRRKKPPISPPLQVLPSIEDKQPELSPCKSSAINQNSNRNNNNNVNEFCSTTVIEFDHKGNNDTAYAVKTISQSGYIITENVLPSENVFPSEREPPGSHNDSRKKFLIRTLTQSELQIIREVGKTLLSDSDDTTSIISNENSSTTDMNSSSGSTQENFPSNKRGIVRKMARMIENGLKEQQKQNVDQNCVPRPADPRTHKSTTVINKLLMGESVTHPQHKIEIGESNSLKGGKVNAPTAPRYLSSSPSSGNLQDLINLVGPTPYSPTRTTLATSKELFEKKSVEARKFPEKNEAKGIRRTQSERSVIRPIKMIFQNRRSKQHMRHASASKSHPALPTYEEGCLKEDRYPALSFKPVKDIVRSIENSGKKSSVKRSSSLHEAGTSRYLSGASPAETKAKASEMKNLLQRSKSNPQFLDESGTSPSEALRHTTFKIRSHHKRKEKGLFRTDNPFYNSM